MGRALPDRVRRAAPLAGTARICQHCVLWAHTLVDALRSDPGYADGWYAGSSEVRGSRWTPATCSPRRGSGSTATSAGTPAGTSRPALGRITATTSVMPVSSDTFGHASLFGLTRSYTDEVDAALKELLATGG